MQIAVVGTNQCIAEIPGIGGKEVVGYFESQRFQILYHKDSRTTGIALTKSMNLPEVSTETGQMTDGFIDAFTLIAIVPFLSHVILQCLADSVSTGVIDRFTSQHPFLLGDIIVADTTSKLIDTFKQASMDGRQLRW